MGHSIEVIPRNASRANRGGCAQRALKRTLRAERVNLIIVKPISASACGNSNPPCASASIPQALRAIRALPQTQRALKLASY